MNYLPQNPTNIFQKGSSLPGGETTFEQLLGKLSQITPEEGDYLGPDGLLYCGKCHTPKQFRKTEPPMKGQLFPHLCQCRQEKIEKERAAEAQRIHQNQVARLKKEGFSDPVMQSWTFQNDNGQCSQMEKARSYVTHWKHMEKENIGYLLWGSVGAGKSYFAGCIANALMEQGIPVYMRNFSQILNELSAKPESRSETFSRLFRCPLLILDDFGMERDTPYGLEQMYHIIDGRSRSQKPLIVTTNLTLTELQNPQDIYHARIYDRVLEMCAPILFSGESLRQNRAKDKLNRLAAMLEAPPQKQPG